MTTLVMRTENEEAELESKSFTLLYRPDHEVLNLKGIEKFLEKAQSILEGARIINNRYVSTRWQFTREPPARYVRVSAYISTVPIFPCFKVSMGGFCNDQFYRDKLSEATLRFIEFVGVPSFVEGGYDVINPILSKYGKTTKRKFFDKFFDGKHVIDVK